MIRKILALAIAMTTLIAQGCGNRPDEAHASQLATRLSQSLSCPDSLVVAAAAINSWIAPMDAVQSIEARSLLMEHCPDSSTAAAMLTLLHQPYWTGWELSKQCCDNILTDSTLTKSQIIGPIKMARTSYLVCDMRDECDLFDMALQDYINSLPIGLQMEVYLRVSSIPRLAKAVKDVAAKNPAEAIEAVEALHHLLDKQQFKEFMNIYQQK